jgi:FAD/FMN-containing dehydrogenase
MTIEASSSETIIDTVALTILQGQLRGELLTPGAPGYDEARRLNNGRYNRRPAVIARCRSAEDVARAVRFARDHGLEVAIRSGGHSVPGHSNLDGGMMIDLSQLKQIDVDPARRIARVGPGATNGELVLALAPYGLATTTGTCATVGMGGSTLGGGIGWLMGRFGMSIDNVLEFELVTADGQIRIASEEEHPELFWALRGGGGNFGVVTNITYRLHELGPVLGGLALFPMAAAPVALRMYRELTTDAPDELMAHAMLAAVPDFGPALILQAVYSGEDLAAGERLLAPIRRFGPPPVDLIAPRPYAEAYMMLTPPPMAGLPYVDTAFALRRPSNAALDELLACAVERPSPISGINIHLVHGAATRVAPDATAFALREPHYAVVNAALWMEGSGEAETLWAWHTLARMRPHASPGLYVNFLGDEGEGPIRDAYRANYDRLAAIKAQYDPENFFHRNQNIKPAEGR